MNTEILGIIIIYLLSLSLAIPTGFYMAKVYADQKTWLDFLQPLENWFFRLSGINAQQAMTWQTHLRTMLTINLLWFFWAMFVLMNQGWLPLNPDQNPSMSPDLAFNTAVSFLVNCNLQHYSGETGVSYFSQIFCLMFLQFVTAATGMAVCAVVFKAMKAQTSQDLGNFYNYFLKSCTRILLPLSIVVAIILAFSGTPMTWEGKAQLVSLAGDTIQVSRGPAAAMIAIKQLGTNGGGYFGVNSAHPLENPSYVSNLVESIAIFLIPMAMVFALGFYLNRKKLAYMIFGVMTLGFLLLLAPTVYYEMQTPELFQKMGLNAEDGAMEGKEVRLGTAASAYWAIATTVTSNGSVNSMHDSLMPISGMTAMLGMMINALYGGVGVGFLSFYIFIILAVFISGLMVGRTPEFLGKKVEAREIKIAMIVALLHPLLILGMTALAAYLSANQTPMGWWFADAEGKSLAGGAWLNNPNFHGFSEMLYEYTSSAANNGSGFEGLADNNPFWNITTGIVLLLSRYIPIIGPVAIAGILAGKKYIPASAGTLQTDTFTFGLMVFAVIFIIAALAFFPALALGPLAEFFAS
jgi:potassium-transporting ATPase potassium-binding subunit